MSFVLTCLASNCHRWLPAGAAWRNTALAPRFPWTLTPCLPRAAPAAPDASPAGSSSREGRDGSGRCATAAGEFGTCHQGIFRISRPSGAGYGNASRRFAWLFGAADSVLAKPSSSGGKCPIFLYLFFTLYQREAGLSTGACADLADGVRGWGRAARERLGWASSWGRGAGVRQAGAARGGKGCSLLLLVGLSEAKGRAPHHQGYRSAFRLSSQPVEQQFLVKGCRDYRVNVAGLVVVSVEGHLLQPWYRPAVEISAVTHPPLLP